MKTTFKKGQVRNRITLWRPETVAVGEWTMVDELDSFIVGFSTRTDAEAAARFARAYIRKHGDIYFGSFPYSLDQPLPTEKDCKALDIPYHTWKE